MKRLLLLPVLFGLIALPTARADHKEEDAAIHHRHDEWVAAWNKHDPKLLASFWVAEGDLINPWRRQAKGPAEIEKLFTDEHTGTGFAVGTTYAGTIENIRYLGKNVAIVDVAGEVNGLKGPDGAAAPPMKHHITWVAEKRAGKWMAVAARPCFPAPMPAAPAK
jgi:uncharacterized protein (TIGR02246 family)